MDYASLIPVNIITGFLGSGKTTLLQRMLASPQLADSAVLINEFGEVGLDHHLLQTLDEQTVLLQSGCVCCTIRGDFKTAVRDLFSRRERGEVPPFRRLLIETTGLADPSPIIYTILAEPVIQNHFRLGNVVTTVDAVNGLRQFDQYPETVKQVAVADRLVVTKTDLADPEQTSALVAALRRINPAAPLVKSAEDAIEPNDLLVSDVYQADEKMNEVRRWLAEESTRGAPVGADHGHGHAASRNGVSRHAQDIESFCLTFEGSLDWSAFGIWLTMLLNTHGENVLRVKGLLNVQDLATPVVIHGVQHLIHPLVHLDSWPDDDRRSRVVFIVRGLSRERIEASLAAFNRLGESASRTIGEPPAAPATK